MRIFQIGPYPIDKPLHGGQIRVAEIHRRLRCIGATVRYTAVYVESQYTESSDSDIRTPSQSPWIDHNFPNLADYFAGVHLVNDADTFKHLSYKLSAFQPTIIWIEQLWAWPAVRRWIAENGHACQVCYSSHNIEHDLKLQMHTASGDWLVDGADPARLVEHIDKIMKIELDCAREAQICVATSEGDAVVLRDMGATRVLIVPNGVARRTADLKRLQHWQSFFAKRRYVAVVGSGHPPNTTGFWECLGGRLGFLRPDEFILSIGGMCSLLRESPQYKRLGSLAEDRIQLAGVVSEVDLVALLAGSCGIILPIRTGGGTNLKTAEALATGKPILATTMALRGFDFASTLSNVVVADDAMAFQAGIRYLFDTADEAMPEQGIAELKLREGVYWEHCLASITATSLLTQQSNSLQKHT